ncbi:hypothetical protein [Streptomyces sp. S.PB5]|uniref:hypothetical protein n=1 Tax=Streptomyces sp. S.PB5 TaxID=3020844 RepID=UPI0025AF62DE|nr:hypothetical protein [Streptomyces sp. S.PB5]MDN3024283.1 hypothetical protein [Streptomyces sp. S.PB5]
MPAEPVKAEPVKFAYRVPDVSGGLVAGKIEQRTDWGFGLNVPAIQLVFVNFCLGIAGGALRTAAANTREKSRSTWCRPAHTGRCAGSSSGSGRPPRHGLL